MYISSCYVVLKYPVVAFVLCRTAPEPICDTSSRLPSGEAGLNSVACHGASTSTDPASDCQDLMSHAPEINVVPVLIEFFLFGFNGKNLPLYVMSLAMMRH